MQYYFTLQYKMLNRQLTDFGLHPIAGYLLSLFAFFGLSVYLFSRTEYAAYIYTFITANVVLGLSETCRNRFIKTCFNRRNYYRIRLIENILVILPFVAVLLYEKSFLPIIFLLITSFFLVRFNLNTNISFTVPTPFYKRPFEFIVGFRSTYFFIALSYILAIIAVSVDNFNLGIFALVAVIFIGISYHGTVEAKYYAWIFSLTPKEFLRHKIKTAILFSSILSLPIVVFLGIVFNDHIVLLTGLQFLGYLYPVTVILAKYSTFPKQLSLPQVLLLCFCFSFPPLLIGVIPFFYRRAVKSINKVLA